MDKNFYVKITDYNQAFKYTAELVVWWALDRDH